MNKLPYQQVPLNLGLVPSSKQRAPSSGGISLFHVASFVMKNPLYLLLAGLLLVFTAGAVAA